jgi:rare lipoprotein A
LESPAPPIAAVPPQGHITTASWYGPGFYGRRTSDGEVFTRNGLTAASRTLPMGSRVRVTNLNNGRSVVVRINDRGPYVHGRGIDLSQGAARQIGLDRSGVARVQIASADSETASASLAPTSSPEQWSGQVRVRHHTPHRRRRTYHYRYASTTTSSKQMVSNPIGDWVLEMVR